MGINLSAGDANKILEPFAGMQIKRRGDCL